MADERDKRDVEARGYRPANYSQLLDEVNRAIIDEMLVNPQISQVELAKRLGMSQSSIAVRLDKLKQSGLIGVSIGLDPSKLGLKMCRVDVSSLRADKVIEWANKCPLCINSTLGIGGDNISLFLVAEDMEMFQYLVEHHIRKIRGVTNCTFNTILRWSKDHILPIALNVQKKDIPPCGIEPFCPRCPANPYYNGTVWSNGIKSRT